VRRILAETAPADAPADANAARDPSRPRFTQWARNVWAKTRRIRCIVPHAPDAQPVLIVCLTCQAMRPRVPVPVCRPRHVCCHEHPGCLAQSVDCPHDSCHGGKLEYRLQHHGILQSSIAFNITAFFNEATDENAQDNHGDDQAQVVDRGLGDQPAAGGEGVVGNPEPL
jgi:hypothetical protein